LHVENQNFQIRRLTRFANGLNKKLANHRAAVAIHFLHFNFCRVHKAIRVTLAMDAGLSDYAWELAELIELMEKRERAVVGNVANRRGPYRVKGSN